jgi:hypothetical protein
MKFSKLVVMITLLFVADASIAQVSQFNYKRKIQKASTDSEWNSVILPHDIYKHIRPDFGDLRIYEIVQSDTNEIPYLLDILDTETKTEEVALPSINESRNNGDYFLTFQNSGFKVNYLELVFAEPNYFATVKVEGSNDKQKWFELVSGEKIFSVNNERQRYASSIVNFPLTDYNYLRLTISSRDKLTFSKGIFRLDEIKPGVFDEITSKFFVTTDKKSRRTVIDVRMPEYTPVSNLTIDVADEQDYYRQMTVEALHDSTKTEKGWIRNYQTIAASLITSFRPNEISIPFTLTNRLRVTIQNYDNPPLKVNGIKVSGVRVQLRARLTGADAYLFYGNAQAYHPTYDIEHFKEKVPIQNAEASLGKEEKIGIAPTSMSAIFENKMWLWGIILATVGLLGFFTLRMMKSKPA